MKRPTQNRQKEHITLISYQSVDLSEKKLTIFLKHGILQTVIFEEK